MNDESYPKVYLYRRIVEAKLFIDENYREPLNLDHIADEAFYSKFHFLRLFKQAYGRTPHQYHTFVRILHAKDLLKNKKVTAADVCMRIGFESVSSFTSLFKRHTGYTPASFQKLQLRIIEESRVMPLKLVPDCFASARGWIQKSNFEEAIL